MGNPVIMSSMTIYVSDAGSYAPVTVLIAERPDSVHLTYDTMESYLNEAALEVARELDGEVLRVLEEAEG
jgi:L-alanine-DL-glutamate epimerase-like enolase superfamily enzyme